MPQAAEQVERGEAGGPARDVLEVDEEEAADVADEDGDRREPAHPVQVVEGRLRERHPGRALRPGRSFGASRTGNGGSPSAKDGRDRPGGQA